MCPYRASEVAKRRIMQVQSPKITISTKSVHQNQKITPPLENLENFTQFQKKIHLNWSLDDQVMASQSQIAKSKINLERVCTSNLLS